MIVGTGALRMFGKTGAPACEFLMCDPAVFHDDDDKEKEEKYVASIEELA